VRYWILLALITIKFVLQYVLVNPIYELHRDEFLHLDQAFHPAAGYISVPPFSSWMASLIYLLGGGLFWIRFVPAFFGALTVVYGWLIVEELGGKLPAKILTSILLIFSVYTRLNVLFQPNSFDILTWTIVFYFLVKYIRNYNAKWLFLLSVITALGLYNKYTIVFLIIGLTVGLLMTEQRSVFTKKYFYYALGLSFLLFLPNIIWQILNHFPVIHHMQALRESQLVNVNRVDFLFDQIKYGVIGIPTIIAFWALLFYKPFKPYRFVIWTFIIVITLFTISSAKSYYTLGLYPVLFAFGSVYLEILFKKWKIILISLLVISNIAAFFFIVKYLMPFQNPSEIIKDKESYERIGLLRWEDGLNHPLPQDFADMLGWKEMADKALTAYQMIPTQELQNTLIFCDNYGQAGALNYYNRNKTSEAYSFNTDYIYWLPKSMKIQNVLYVGSLPNKEVLDMFESYKQVGVVENEFAREQGTKIFLLQGAKDSAHEMFFKIAEERKNNFDIF
jgi:4-amino-4-deoxy-L-arabinose transferase-like glycosyltransferase